MKKITCFLSFLLLVAHPVHCQTLEQKLNVHIGVFDAAKVAMTYSLDDESYVFSSNVETNGLFAKLYYFNALYSSKGKIGDNNFITQDYNYISKSKSHIRTKKLVFDDKGKLIERLSSKDNKTKKVKIDITNKVFDFNDLQSVFAYLTKQLKDNKSCNLKKEVFDGKKNYEISAIDEGFDYINEDDINYKGRAKKCSIIIKRTDNRDEDLLFSTTADRPINFWVAQEQQTLLPFVVKIEIDSTPLGKVKAYTTDINVKD